MRPADRATSNIDQTVTLGGSAWLLLDAWDLGTWIEATAPYARGEVLETCYGRFVLIRYRVVNQSPYSQTLRMVPLLVDQLERTIHPLENEGDYLLTGMKRGLMETLPPHAEREFASLFGVPADSGRLWVRFSALDGFDALEYPDVTLKLGL